VGKYNPSLNNSGTRTSERLIVETDGKIVAIGELGQSKNQIRTKGSELGQYLFLILVFGLLLLLLLDRSGVQLIGRLEGLLHAEIGTYAPIQYGHGVPLTVPN
jgi:hypothetical protein